jgi:colicin import membrane protein
VIKRTLSGAAAVALLAAPAAHAAVVRGDAPAWLVTPVTDSCQTEIELTGASGASTTVTLVSDGAGFQLVYARPESPERAFLPIRIDHKPYANLVLGRSDRRSAAMQLSAESVAAMRRGGVLQIGWLMEEPVQARLGGSEQGLTDLKTCGAQVAARYRLQQAAQQDAAARADAEARAKAVSDEQLAAATAQKEAAEAEARRSAAEADRLQAAAAADRARAQADAQAAADAQRQRAEDDARDQSYPPYARAGEYPDARGGYDEPADPYRGYDPPRSPYRW